MQRDIVVKSRGLGGSADLTLLAPIKPGFIESLESVTYKTRIKRVLETLHGGRTMAHEHHTARLLSDSVERVGTIHSVRVAVLEPEDKVLLAVTFDGSWESYIRVLWDKVGTLLDLIFCGTVDYVTAHDHSFDEWLVWARRVQVETGFFYGPPDSTARDVLYQRRVEPMQLRGAGTELNEIRAVLPSAQEALQRLVSIDVKPPFGAYEDEPRVVRPEPLRMIHERFLAGMHGLAALYRLTDLHPPSTPDGDVLRRATIDLLLEFVQLQDAGGSIQTYLEEARDKRFARQIGWLFPDLSIPDPPKVIVPRPTPTLPAEYPTLDERMRRDVQGGILHPYRKITHGLVLMLEFSSAAAAGEFLDWVDTDEYRLTNDLDSNDAESGVVFRNLALTPAGLRAAGLDEDTLELFPEEFRQGMAARAGSIGDVRNNHPRRWRLPKRLVREDLSLGAEAIEIGSVHAVVQLCCSAPESGVLWEPGHPLRAEVERLREANPGLRLLAVQPLCRRYRAEDPQQVEDHFGYADGFGQPDIEKPAAPVRLNRIPLGEIILGHENSVDFDIDLSDPQVPEAAKERKRWLANGSFLVMRKYRQYARRLERAVARTATEMSRELKTEEDFTDLVYAKLVGRWRNGTPLVPHNGSLNNFLYDTDPQGQQCPLHAHIRLAHPRLDKGSSAARLPRLMRRGMSYGPAHEQGKDDDDDDRGIVFMAYNASIGEQYEVVQRWLAGGNSTGSSSGQSCPIVGVPENGLVRHFRFEHPDPDPERDAHVFRVALEYATPLFEEPAALTRLEWGLYLFTPSLSALRRLRSVAATAASVAPAAASVPWRVEHGRNLIAALQKVQAEHGENAAVEAWKTALEDPESIDRLDSAAVWAAIRSDHGGVLKTPYGTLVASRELLLSQVLLDPHERYSVCGQLERMKCSFGDISLGMDAGPVYEEQSRPINDAIGALTNSKAGKLRVFDIARKGATAKIEAIVNDAKEHAGSDPRYEVGFDAREVLDQVLADLSEAWFGLQDDPGGRFSRGSADWAWKRGDPPPYPGHFTALSRYMFQPNPGTLPIELGQAYGQALREAMILFVADHRARKSPQYPNGTTPSQPDGSPAPIALATFSHATHGQDDDFVARNMVGVLMGFNPTIIGAVLNVLREWHRDGTFGALRAQLAGRSDYDSAHAVIAGPMAAAARMRPMPQIGWRTVRKPHSLETEGAGVVELAVGDKVVMGFVSGTQQSLADGQCDGRLMFGGERPADKPHPTHACPGYEAAIEAMVGTLAALLAWDGTMRQGAAPLIFMLEGESGYVPSKKDLRALRSWQESAHRRNSFEPSGAISSGSRGLIMGWGDSWLNASIVLQKDLKQWLKDFGYVFVGDSNPGESWTYPDWATIKSMADDASLGETSKFYSRLKTLIGAGTIPQAILLSGGGDDSTGDALRRVLNPEGTLPLLNDRAADEHVVRLDTHYRTVLGMIAKIEDILRQQGKPMIPVIVHGYDYPIPRKRPPNYMEPFIYPLLRKPFFKHGCDTSTQKGRDDAKAVMHELIRKLNVMLSELPKSFLFVRYVDLRETIKESADLPDGWHDDLHALSESFKLMAEEIDTAIQIEVS